jgi:Na+(H+)/acetate symporter ActP
MKGITIVQAFQFWLKLTAIAVPALFLLIYFHHPAFSSLRGEAPPTFATATTVKFSDAEQVDVQSPVTVQAYGVVDGVHRHGPLLLAAGGTSVGAGSSLRFPAGATAPTLTSTVLLNASEWESPLVRINGVADHPLAATYGVVLATFLGALGLPHILVRFYTNPDGAAARKTTTVVLLFLACFYVFPAIFAALGRLDAPQLYTSGQTDSVVLVLPRLVGGGAPGAALAALTAGGAFAAFLSTSSGLLISMSGALSHDLMGKGVRAFRTSALASGLVATACGLVVAGVAINVLVGWAFAIAASSLCPLLLLGIWWPGLTWKGAFTGLVLGGGASSLAVVATMLGAGKSGWPAVLLGEPAILAVPLAFLTMVGVSKLTRSSLPPNVTAKLLALHLPEAVRPT